MNPTKKLVQAYRSCENVMLVFLVNETSNFQGFARMESEPSSDLHKDAGISLTYLQNNHNVNYPVYGQTFQLQDNFKVKWFVKCDINSRDFRDLPGNALNDNQPLKHSKNGQEIQKKLGNYLCHLLYFSQDPSVQLLNPI